MLVVRSVSPLLQHLIRFVNDSGWCSVVLRVRTQNFSGAFFGGIETRKTPGRATRGPGIRGQLQILIERGACRFRQYLLQTWWLFLTTAFEKVQLVDQLLSDFAFAFGGVVDLADSRPYQHRKTFQSLRCWVLWPGLTYHPATQSW